MQQAPITGNIIRKTGQVGTYPNRNPGLMINTTPIKQTTVKAKCILCSFFWWRQASTKWIMIGPVLNNELAIPRGINGTLPRKNVKADEANTDLFIKVLWTYLLVWFTLKPCWRMTKVLIINNNKPLIKRVANGVTTCETSFIFTCIKTRVILPIIA